MKHQFSHDFEFSLVSYLKKLCFQQGAVDSQITDLNLLHSFIHVYSNLMFTEFIQCVRHWSECIERCDFLLLSGILFLEKTKYSATTVLCKTPQYFCMFLDNYLEQAEKAQIRYQIL